MTNDVSGPVDAGPRETPRPLALPDGTAFDSGSFRDPWGRVVFTRDQVLRYLSDEGLRAWEALDRSPLQPPRWGADNSAAAPTGDQRIVPTRRIDDPRSCESLGTLAPNPSLAAAVLEHERLPWIGHPYEWSFGMLRDAALLQLELLRDALPQGLILRDGTPYNVQFRGTQPLLIDVLSLAPLLPGQAWDGYRQFCESMLFPLFLASWRGINFRTLLRGRLEGIPVGECRRMLSWGDLFRRGMWGHVLVQDWLGHQSPALSDPQGTISTVDLRPIIDGNVRGLIRTIERLRTPQPESHWIDYDAVRPHYTPEDQARKDAFVAAALSGRGRSLVWDLGCNTGRFSRLAAAHADCVVAMDSDPACIERLYQQLAAERNRTIVPAVVDLADPPGGLGWRNRERAALTERSRPDAVFALAVLHHLVFRNAIPLDDVVDWLASLADELIVEFVGPDDVMVRELMRQRRQVHSGYTWDRFHARLSQTHRVLAQQPLCEGRRILVHAVRTDSIRNG